MKKVHTSFAIGVLAALVLAGMSSPGFADANGQAGLGPALPGVQLADAAMNFGSPPSGEIPILYNDHHVYANPDRLKQGRVLAALVKNGAILVPLRSMFEAMGATVKWDPASKTATVQKAGASVQVTLGKNEAIINGESRPLDVPPEIYKGVVVVPIRVMSEAMGAYVQWVPDRRLAVVRYLPPTPVPPPPPPPPPPPTAAPSPTPTPAPAAPSYNGFLQGAYVWHQVSNEFAAQVRTTSSYQASAAILFNPIAIEGRFRSDQYPTTVNGVIPPTGAVCTPTNAPNNPPVPGNPATIFSTIDGGTCYVPPFTARQQLAEGRLEYKVFDPHVYIGAAYGYATTNYGYPRLGGVGFGIEKMPDLNNNFTVHGSYFYYPSMSGNYTVNDPLSPNFGVTFKQQYHIQSYDAGIDYVFSKSFPIYLYAGWDGDLFTVQSNAPVNQTHSGPYAGLGFRF